MGRKRRRGGGEQGAPPAHEDDLDVVHGLERKRTRGHRQSAARLFPAAEQLLPKIEEVTVYDETAGKILVTVAMAGTNDGVLGFSADAYRFALELEKDSDDWQLISARWGELGDELR